MDDNALEECEKGQKPLRVGVAGLGNVGVGVVKIMTENTTQLTMRTGRICQITAVSARSKTKNRDVDLSAYRWEEDPLALAVAEDVDVVCELIGGEAGVALSLVRTALENGKHVITANKALLAHHGLELAQLAEQNQVTLAYEAAVAGGIPIIKGLKEGLAANQISRIYGILNGTCNYILTEMRRTGRPFADVLHDAQQLGYAEADPTFDIEGVDAGHKLCLLTALAFGVKPNFDAVKTSGITSITAEDMAYADELGYRVKLLGISEKSDAGITQRVTACMVPRTKSIAHIEDVYNAVVVQGDFVGTSLFQGRGAGEGPTASAVIADLVDIARRQAGVYNRDDAFGVPVAALEDMQIVSEESLTGSFYLRLRVLDQPGVVAQISTILCQGDISLETVLQRGRAPGEAVDLVVTTHDANRAKVSEAIQKIEAMSFVVEKPQILSIETFN